MVVLVLVVAGVVAVFVGLYVWARRAERDIDYKTMRDESTQTDDQRRLEQLGIGLSSNNIGGTLQ